MSSFLMRGMLASLLCIDESGEIISAAEADGYGEPVSQYDDLAGSDLKELTFDKYQSAGGF